MTLQLFFSQHPSVAVALSGGADSAYLLYAAKQFGQRVHAYCVRSPFQCAAAHEDACRLAAEVSVPVSVLSLTLDDMGEAVQNGPDRCYHCKKAMFTAICRAAKADGFCVVLDGTNASDDDRDRPGMRALQELDVLSPLRLCGLDKQTVRRLSEQAGLFTHDKPSDSRLATRIASGTVLTLDALRRVEEAEIQLKQLGFSDFRLRCGKSSTTLQVRQAQLPLALQCAGLVEQILTTQHFPLPLHTEVRS